MKILVANLGSTSFKYRLFDMNSEQQLARGGVERIGSPSSDCFVEIGDSRNEITAEIPDHGVAVQQCLDQLTDPETGCLCLLYTSPSPRDATLSRMPSSA